MAITTTRTEIVFVQEAIKHGNYIRAILREKEPILIKIRDSIVIENIDSGKREMLVITQINYTYENKELIFFDMKTISFNLKETIDDGQIIIYYDLFSLWQL